MSTEVRSLAIVSGGPLQWVLCVVAIAMLVYAAILGSKEGRSKLAILTLAVVIELVAASSRFAVPATLAYTVRRPNDISAEPGPHTCNN
jgi:hypothetical protein